MPVRLPAILAALTVALLVLAAVSRPGTARADGDPASDVLSSEHVFLPADTGASAAQQQALTTVVDAANGHGLAIRVAVINSASDLGSITALWGHPQAYAQFLGTELSLIFSGQVLVVMPSGFGLYHAGSQTAAEVRALTGASTRGSDLVAVATSAVRLIAQASGHTLPQSPSRTTPSSTGTQTRSSVMPFVVLGAGALLVLVAWAASLRAVPLRRSDRRPPPTRPPE